MRLIKESALSMDDQRELLVNAAISAGDFEQVRQLLSTSAGMSYSDQERLTAREKTVAQQALAFVEARKAVDGFVHSPAAVSSCNPVLPGHGLSELDGAGFTLPAYWDAVAKLVRLALLNTEALDFAFHATLTSSDYPSIEEVGDRILAGAGRIRVPGYGSDRYGWLVIDRGQRSLSIEPDSHVFAVSGSAASRVPLVPFELSFDHVTGLSQSVGGLARLGMGSLSGKPAPLSAEARARTLERALGVAAEAAH